MIIETPAWLLDGAVKDGQTITARWTPSALRLIDGVSVHEVLNVPKNRGYLTEIFRADWLRGMNVTVYEGNTRVGGRCWTNRASFDGGQIAEHGGELIDQSHTTIRQLAQELGLPLDNVLAAEPNGKS